MNEITSCEVCGSGVLVRSLNLGSHPMCDDLIPVGDASSCNEFPIEILFCASCRTAHQRFPVPKRALFPAAYHYRSRHTADVINGMRTLAVACEETIGSLDGTKVLDIGCNDGSLLTIFRERGAKSFGIEPTGAADEASALGHVVLNEFLDEDSATRFVNSFGQPDIITFTNVFAHIEDLPAVIRSLKILAHRQTSIVIENHYLGAIIDHRQFDTFYHEHPRTYSYRSFCFIAKSLEMRLDKVEFPSRYGGNIRVFLTSSKDNLEEHDKWSEMEAKENCFGSALAGLAADIEIWRLAKSKQLLDAAKQYGPLRGKAFPGRSAIPIKLLNLDESVVHTLYEKPTSCKIGHYVPGTRIPIVSDDNFRNFEDEAPLVNIKQMFVLFSSSSKK